MTETHALVRPGLTRRTFLLLASLGGAAASKGPAVAAEPEKDGGQMELVPAEKLAADLESDDGGRRLAATRELFRRGKGAAGELRQAGATQPQTIQTRRLDMVYGLLVGLEPGRYLPDSFGLRLDAKGTADDMARMGRKHGFTPWGPFRGDGVPNVYVKLEKGKSLAGVLKQLLTEEPLVKSLNLNYFE